MDLPKKYKHTEAEDKWRSKWAEDGVYDWDPTKIVMKHFLSILPHQPCLVHYISGMCLVTPHRCDCTFSTHAVKTYFTNGLMITAYLQKDAYKMY